MSLGATLSSEPTADYAYDALLRHNYFPMVKNRRDDLPPVFTTEALTMAIADDLISNLATHRRGEGFDQVTYRANRFDNTIRRMDIPHPLPYARFCKCIHVNWAQFAYVYQSTTSQIKPKRHDGRLVVMNNYDNGRIIIMDNEGFSAGVRRHLSLTTGQRYVARADIANCFPSIYSHAIPWALVGFAHAKSHRGNGEWFNQIDSHQRQMKRGETLGVPIGPATSNIMTDAILCRVDEMLLQQGYRFIRFIDDYHCFTESKDRAESFLRDLELELDKYLLKLNRKKVGIHELPIPNRDDWIQNLEFAIGRVDKMPSSRMSSILDFVLGLQGKHKDSNVLKYGATTLHRYVTQSNASLYVNYLMQLSYHHSTIIPQIAETLIVFDVPIDQGVFDGLLLRHLEFRRSDAICWLLLIASVCNLAIPQPIVQRIIDSNDVMAMCMLLAMNQHVNLIDQYLLALPTLTSYELDKYWLLIHERCSQSRTVEQHFRAFCGETGLTYLRQRGVFFLDRSKLQATNRATAFPI